MDEFKNVIEQLIGVFKQLTKVEHVKFNAVTGKHVGTVLGCMYRYLKNHPIFIGGLFLY